MSEGYYFDWTNDDSLGLLRQLNWSKIDGSSICPAGFRIPTINELYLETYNLIGTEAVYNSFLKLSNQGIRHPNDGSIDYGNGFGSIWSVDIEYDSNGIWANRLRYDNNTTRFDSVASIEGKPVRCIKD